MKVFFIDKYSFLTFVIMFSLAGFLFSSADNTAPVYSSFGEKVPIYSVETDEKVVSVTFDTAWGNEDTGEILKVLKDGNCSATFFITGEWADKFPEDVKKIYDAGHEIANHGNTHTHFSSLSRQEMADNISACDGKIKKITNQSEVLFRAPYGEYNKTLLSVCEATGRYIIQWSKDSLDYKGLTAEKMKERIFKNLKNGDIILFHTGTDNTASALPEILTSLKNEGYSFKPVGEIICRDNFTIDHEGRQKPLP